MLRKIFYIAIPFFFAISILLVSILRTAAVKYEFSDSSKRIVTAAVQNTDKVNYCLAFPGQVLPDSPFWAIKALRDKVWLAITTNDSRRSELLLLFADKRLVSARKLIEKGNTDLGYSTLTKAEKYLLQSAEKERLNRLKGENTSEFLQRLNLASLKHIEEIENMEQISPDDVKPKLILTQKDPENVYENTRNILLDKGIKPQANPFECR